MGSRSRSLGTVGARKLTAHPVDESLLRSPGPEQSDKLAIVGMSHVAMKLVNLPLLVLGGPRV
eukprot:2525374-Pyramimonas_sp.AAC.1